MIKYILPLLLLQSLTMADKIDSLSINNQTFYTITERYDLYGSKGEVMRLYTKENNADMTYLVGLTLDDVTGACSDTKRQKGAYESNSTHLTFYSFWDSSPSIEDAPYGVRVQSYRVLDKHTLVLESSKIYIESEKRNLLYIEN